MLVLRRYQSLPTLPITNKCTKLALLKNTAVYFIMEVMYMPMIEMALKIFYQLANAEVWNFEVVITSLLWL